MLIIIALFVVVVIQLVNISKIKNQIESQQQQIETLDKELDYYKNKQPNEDYEVLT